MILQIGESPIAAQTYAVGGTVLHAGHNTASGDVLALCGLATFAPPRKSMPFSCAAVARSEDRP